MEKDRAIDGSSAGKGPGENTDGRVSMAFRSLLFAVWGILLLFIALNPMGLFMMLYVLAVPAWVMGCAGLYCGIRSLAKRQGPRPVAIIGVVLNALIVLLPLYPFIAGQSQGGSYG